MGFCRCVLRGRTRGIVLHSRAQASRTRCLLRSRGISSGAVLCGLRRAASMRPAGARSSRRRAAARGRPVPRQRCVRSAVHRKPAGRRAMRENFRARCGECDCARPQAWRHGATPPCRDARRCGRSVGTACGRNARRAACRNAATRRNPLLHADGQPADGRGVSPHAGTKIPIDPELWDQALAALGAARIEDEATATCLHAGAEAVRARVLELAGLESTLHGGTSLKSVGKRSGKIVDLWCVCQPARAWRHACAAGRLRAVLS